MYDSSRLLQSSSPIHKDDLNYVHSPLTTNYRDFRHYLCVAYYHWRNPTTYLCLICINVYIIISCLMYRKVPLFTLIVEIFVMCTFTFELIARGVIYGLNSLWSGDGKVDTIAYIMCLLSMFGYKDFSEPPVNKFSRRSNDSERYVKVLVISFRIIAQLLRLSRTVVSHYKAKTGINAQSWYEMEEIV